MLVIRVLLSVKLFTAALVSIGANSPAPSDSLWNLYNNAINDSVKTSILLQIGVHYEAFSIDSAFLCYKKVYAAGKKNRNYSQMAEGLRYYGILLSDTGNYSLAEEYVRKALDLYSARKDKNGMASCYLNIGSMNSKDGDYETALESFIEAAKLYEELRDTSGMARVSTSLGNLFYYQNDFVQAEKYYAQSIQYHKSTKDKILLSNVLNNQGSVYQELKNYEKAIQCYEEALQLREKARTTRSNASTYNNMGNAYKALGEMDKALEYYNKSLEIKEKANDQKGISITLGNIAALYNETGRHQDALKLAERVYEIGMSLNSLPILRYAYQYLSEAQEGLGNYKKSLEYHKLLLDAKDSLLNTERQLQINELATRYETEKKELEIQNLNNSNKVKELEILQQEQQMQKQRMLIYGITGGLIILIILMIFISKLYSDKRKANLLLRLQNAEILQKNEEISSQRDEIEAQRETLSVQKNKLEKVHTGLTDSIRYARRIQQALLPSEENLAKTLGEHFILYKPRDIVSGDFYWAIKKENWTLISVADCTGHGVPGAFMSILGISYLNEIVSRKDVTQAAQVINELRDYIIRSLQQSKNKEEIALQEITTTTLNATVENNTPTAAMSFSSVKDGMDLAFIAINTNPLFDDQNNLYYEAQYSGANHPLIVIDSKGFLKEIAPDKKPVAIYPNLAPFTNHIFTLYPGDMLYLFSDGYADQFGGPEAKKYKIRQLRETLQKTAAIHVSEQKKILEQILSEWMAHHDQVDDITILGVKIA